MNYEKQIERFLKEYPDEEFGARGLFDELDIELEEVLIVLLTKGKIVMPEWTEDMEEMEDEEG